MWLILEWLFSQDILENKTLAPFAEEKGLLDNFPSTYTKKFLPMFYEHT
jgi:hypothetical protein